jgi:drug/metabolite transporter (DMT)-like permease
MTPTAVLLIAVSAIAHALWNWLGKRENSSSGFFFTANMMGWLCLLPVLAFAARAVPAMLASAWWLILLTGFFQALYYASLSNAYRDGDLSLVYPIVRSAAVLFVTLANVGLGRAGQLGPLAIAGIGLIVAGILLLPHARFRDITLRGFRSRGMLFALLAAVGTMGYSIVDDHALRLLRPALAPLAPVVTTLLFALLEGASTSLWLGGFVLAGAARVRSAARAAGTARVGVPRLSALRIPPGQLRPALLSGIAIFTAYTLVLIAMGFARNVTYIVAFRQMSIPIGVLLGLAVLREPLNPPKIAGVLTVTAGLVLVALG